MLSCACNGNGIARAAAELKTEAKAKDFKVIAFSLGSFLACGTASSSYGWLRASSG
jgi:hypothetical protein